MSTQTTIVSGSEIGLAPLDVIDYQKLLDEHPDEDRRLLQAAQEVGFFYLDLHGAAMKGYLRDLQELYALQKKFFAQSLEVKMKHHIRDVEQGYKPFEDCQTFEIPRDWLSGGKHDAIPEMLNKPEMREFMSTSSTIATVLLDRMSTALELTGTQHLQNFHRPGKASGSGLKFESVPTVEHLEDVPPSEHTDGGSITMLYCEKYTTQLQMADGGEWLFIEPKSGMAIVNIADALQKVSDGKLKSKLHRVGQPTPGVTQRPTVLYYLRPETETGLYGS